MEAEAVEVVHEVAAEEGLERLVGLVEVHALDHRLGLVEFDVDLRHIPECGGEEGREFRARLGGRHEFLGVRRDEFHGGARAVFEHEGHAAGGADARDGGRREREGRGRVFQRGKFAVDGILDGVHLEFGRGAFRPFLEGDEEEAGVGALDGAEEVEADDRGDIFHARGLEQDVLDFFRGGGGLLERGGAGELDDAKEVALVLLGDEGRGELRADEPARGAEADEDDHGDGDLADEAAADGFVALRGGAEDVVEALEERAERAACFLAGAEQEGAEGGAEREGVERREEDRDRHGHGELLIHRAGDARDECRGDEHRGEDEGDGDHWAGNLRHRLDGGIARGEPLLDVGLDGFDNDDGVVHHEADREDHAEKGERVDREAQHREHGEGADERDRDGDERDERGAPALQEDEDDGDDEDHRLEERLDDFLDAVGDGERGVERDGVFEPRGEEFRLLREEIAELFHCVHGVRARELVDGDDAGVLALEAAADVVNLAAEFHAGDILHADDRAVGVGADDDLLKFLDGGEAAGGGDGEGENLALRDGFAADLAGRVDLVLGGDGGDDLGDRDVERGEAVRLHPDAHRVLARAEDAHAADALDAAEGLVEVDVGVIRQEGRIEFAARGGEDEDAERGGKRLLDRDAVVAHLLREL